MSEPFDFLERHLHRLPASDPDEGDETLGLTMKLAYAVGHAEFRQQANLHVVSGAGLETILVALPFASLKKLAAFIQETIKEYEERTS